MRTLEGLQPTETQFQQAHGLALKAVNDALRNQEVLSLGLSKSIGQGDWRLWFALSDGIEAVTLADVRRVAAAYLVAANRTLGSYLPARKPPPRAFLTPRVDVAARLADYKGRDVVATASDYELTPENIEAHVAYRCLSVLSVLGEPGLRLAILPRCTKGDRVTGTLRLHWGSAESLNGQSVPAGMVGPMLVVGTRQRSQDDIARALLALDARLSITSSAAGLTANFELPAVHLAAFDALLSELLREPAFDDAVIANVHRAMLVMMQNQRADTTMRAENALLRVFAAPTAACRAAGRYAVGERCLRAARCRRRERRAHEVPAARTHGRGDRWQLPAGRRRRAC